MRDWFAGMALAEVPDPSSIADAPTTAKLAYAIADAMLIERKAPPQPIPTPDEALRHRDIWYSALDDTWGQFLKLTIEPLVLQMIEKAAIAAMSRVAALSRARPEEAIREAALEEAAQIADDGTCLADCPCCHTEKGIARTIRNLKSDRPKEIGAAAAVLEDLRGRKLLKYLFAADPENHGPYGYISEPIDLEAQQECAESLVRTVLKSAHSPAPRVDDAKDSA